jgi:hypothetical protein
LWVMGSLRALFYNNFYDLRVTKLNLKQHILLI